MQLDHRPHRREIEYPLYLFNQGTNYRSYELLGAHPCGDGFVFRVFAPNARAVHLTGDFNSWNRSSHPMERIGDSGVWDIVLPLAEGELYKYCVTAADGHQVLKCDPYGYYGETVENTASITYSLSGKHCWGDHTYFGLRCRKSHYTRPMNIYEINLGSWKQKRLSNDPNTFIDEPASYYNYRELADLIIPYLVEMSYTHVEVMPWAEFPFIGSWGYQVGCYYAPTARYGRPEDLMYFVDKCHQAGIGVIVDWVPAHFPRDAHGLYLFDGGPLYESPDSQKRQIEGWGTHQFDFGRTQVQSFLISNALFWLEHYHVDGLRVDAVSSILYLDFGREPGKWTPNIYGGNENLDGVAFLKKLNTAVREQYPDRMMIAEESTAWPRVTEPVEKGGLGFHYKWNMGWMNDVLSYLKTDPVFRSPLHSKLTFSMMYAFNENYILPISHDEVVHGKASLLDKSPGYYYDKFASTRAFLGYMMSHPGKKLLFMGSELGQFLEWNYRRCIDFELLEYKSHRKFHEYVKVLNRFYREHPAFWKIERGWEGFQWIQPDACDDNTIVYLRRHQKGGAVIVIVNFSPVRRDRYLIGVPYKGEYKVLLCSDDVEYGGAGTDNHSLTAISEPYQGQKYSLRVNVPPLACVYIGRKSKGGV